MAKAAKRKLMRSGSCKCPISGYIGPLVRHHINGREVPDADGEWNIVWVSPDSHQDIHLGKVIIEGWFHTSAGRELIWRKSSDIPIVEEGATPKGYDGAEL